MKICKFCGRELTDESLFCGYCGNRCEDGAEDGALDKGEGQEEIQKESQDGNQRSDQSKEYGSGMKKKSFIPVIVGGIALAAAGGTFFAMKHFAGSGILGQKEAGAENIFDLSQAELAEQYEEPEGLGVIDLVARNHQPAARDVSAKWDKGLFYRLEDIGGEDDNHIADYFVTRMELVRSDSGKLVEYEVYREPETGQVEKIVSIETKEDGSLELSDYYYLDGKPDFVFRRSDSVYTPSYATIDKTGERYYFSGDQMVKWRWIYEPSVVKQWILEPEDTWYTQWGYGEISEGEQGQYDEKEMQVLNEAYNTYEAIAANEPVNVLRGCVVDRAGKPLEGVEVGIGKIVGGEIQKPKVKVVTSKEGKYAWAVGEEPEETAEKTEYFLVFCKDGWIPSVMKLADMGTKYQIMQAAQDDMILLEEDGEKAEEKNIVTFNTYQVEAQGEEEILERAFADNAREEKAPALGGATVTVYPGVNWILGSPAAEGESSADGKTNLELAPGVYTAVVEKEGFLCSRKVFFVEGRDEEQVIYAMASENSMDGAEEEWKILLSWNASEADPMDLDSSLFTPDKASMGDRNCIYTLNRSDDAGARLLYDGEGCNACEIITLSAPKRGSYKYYVTNYTDIQAGNKDSANLADSGALVTVFHNGVPVRTFSVPKKAGTVWEVFELRNQDIVPVQEVYGNVEGKGWWTEDKKLARLSERGLRADWIQSDGEWLYFSNPADEGKLYYCRKDGSGLTKFSDNDVWDSRIILAGDQVYYVGDRSIARIKNDGTGYTVIKDGFQLAETAEPSLYLLGYADGMLYYYNAPESFGGVGALFVGEEENLPAWPAKEEGTNGSPSRYSFGEMPVNAMTAGHYLYYLDRDYNNIGDSLSFCRKDLESGQEECLKAAIDWDPWSWRIYKGWVYYKENGAFKRTRLLGQGSFTEEDTLVESGAGYGSGQIISFYDDKCYYTGEDGQICVMDPDGSSQKALPVSGGSSTILDGELYRAMGYGGTPVMVCDRNGENQRALFDAIPLMNQGAMQAYRRYLENYVPDVFESGEGSQYNMGPDFACQDIDGDGIVELFVWYGHYRDSYMDYCRYGTSGIQTIWKTQPCSKIVFNENAKEIAIEDVVGNYHARVARFQYDGSLIEKIYGDPISIDPSGMEAFNRAYESYVEPYPTLNFVENTPENRQKYLSGDEKTGWAP